MTNPTDEELNAAILKALDGSTPISFDDGWRDWNILMAAVAELEEWIPNSFERVTVNNPKWHVRFKGDSAFAEFEYGDSASEARALARCIHAAVNQ